MERVRLQGLQAQCPSMKQEVQWSTVHVNGAAARRANVGDKVIILAYEVGWEARPSIVKVDDDNNIRE